MADEKEIPAQLAPHFNIKAVINQTGLNPATIRAWERGYGVPTPQRSKGGHRQYSHQDIDTLKWLIARQNEGISISHAIEMFQALYEAGQNPLAEEEAAIDGLFQFTSEVASEQVEQLREAWIVACLAFDRQTAEQFLSQAFALFPAEVVSFQLLQKSLSEIGQRWYENKVTVQQEHFTPASGAAAPGRVVPGSVKPIHREAALIESHIWSAFVVNQMPRKDLATINNEISCVVSAALKVGDINLLSGGLHWHEYLLMAYRLPAGFLNEYIRAFYQDAVVHLGGPGNMVVDWLAGLMDEVDNVVT